MVRLITKHFWIVNLIFIAAAVWLIVYLGMAVVKDQLSPVPKPGAGKEGIAAPAKGGKAYKQYAVIPERNIFDPSEKGLKLLALGAGRVESRPGGEGSKAAPPGGYRLIGTITGPGRYSFAVIQDASGKQTVYPIDSDLGGAKIIRISRKEVVILRDGGEETLSLAEGGGAGPKAGVTSSLTPVAAAEVVKRLSPNRFVVNREDVNKAVGNVNQFMTQARIKPFLQSGHPSGFTIFEIQTGSLIEKLGMRNNDIIKKVNGQPINKPEEIFQAYSQLQRDGNIEIEIERNERAEVLKYEIR